MVSGRGSSIMEDGTDYCQQDKFVMVFSKTQSLRDSDRKDRADSVLLYCG